MEIERKYLVEYLPNDLEKYPHCDIEQCYLCTSPTLRVRRMGDEYWLTVKEHIQGDTTAIVNREEEFRLTKEKYQSLKSKCDGSIISKTRYKVDLRRSEADGLYEGLIAEVDIFHGEHEGLRLVEVEFSDVRAANNFTPPDWFGEDVSGDARYRNSTLRTKNDKAMKRFLLTLIIVAIQCPLIAMAQEDSTEAPFFIPPAYDSIFSMVKDKHSPYNYGKLTKRFMKGDTTLDLQDVRCLYYGYPAQENFSPYSKMEELKTVQGILNGENPSKDELKRAYQIAEKGLEKKPSDIILVYWKAQAAYYGYGEESKELMTSLIQFDQLQWAIGSSGNGRDESPIFITSMEHSYFIMHLLGLTPEMQMLVYDTVHRYTCDVFPVKDEDGGYDTIYFEVSKVMSYWSNLSEKKENLNDKKKQEAITLEEGCHFVIKPRSIKKKNSLFDVVVMEEYKKPLSLTDKDKLFEEGGAEGTIEGYFGYDADTTHTLLITKSWCKKAVDFDLKIYDNNTSQWDETSNNGNWPGAVGAEMWRGEKSRIEISNLRKKK